MEVLYLKINERKGHYAEKILKNVEWKAHFWNVDVERKVVNSYDSLVQRMKENDMVIMGIGKKTIFGCKIGHLAQFVATHSPVPVIFVHKMKERWSGRTSGK